MKRVKSVEAIRGPREVVAIKNMLPGQGNYPLFSRALRKTWGCQARKQGIPIELIRAKLGHRFPAVTRRYIGITAEEMGEIKHRAEL